MIATVLTVFIWMALLGWQDETPQHRVFGAIFAGFMALIAFSCIFPKYARIPIRIIAGMVALATLWYVISEVIDLLQNGSQPIAIGEPSAVMAALALIVFGIPAIALAVGGEVVSWVAPLLRKVRSGKRRDEEGNDVTHTQRVRAARAMIVKAANRPSYNWTIAAAVASLPCTPGLRARGTRQIGRT
jgi:hypothetical protein